MRVYRRVRFQGVNDYDDQDQVHQRRAQAAILGAPLRPRFHQSPQASEAAIVWSFDGQPPKGSCDHQWQECPVDQVLGEETVTGMLHHRCNICLLLQDQSYQASTGSGPLHVVLKLAYNEEIQTRSLDAWLGSSQLQHPIRSLTDWWRISLKAAAQHEDLDTGSSAATALTHTWLSACMREHKACHTRKCSYSPTRLVELLRCGNLRLVELPNGPEPYIALSHRWNFKSHCKTTLTNVRQRYESLPDGSLSPTMRDAVEVVRRLGFRFLWIDALCIIQDSDEDWLLEASKMSHVYQNAVLTIAAADCENHEQGIFRPRAVRCLRPFPVKDLRKYTRERIWWGQKITKDEEKSLHIFPGTKGARQGIRPKGTLDTRGWILQEQLLSARVLYFDRGELFWECITCSASESSPISASLLEDDNPDETWAFRFLRRTISGADDPALLRRHLADVWNLVVQNYSRRSLTKVSDMLVALQGVMQALECVLGEPSLAGMWKQSFWYQLIWWTDIKIDWDVEPSPAFPAPSWSWMSAKGPVSHHNSLQPNQDAGDRKLADLVSLHTIDTIEATNSPSNTSISGVLLISAQSFAYQLTSNDMKSFTWKRWHHSKLNIAPANWILDSRIEMPALIQCLILGEDEAAKVTVCLCLVPAEPQSDIWKRVGLCHWNGLSWQISSSPNIKIEIRGFQII